MKEIYEYTERMRAKEWHKFASGFRFFIYLLLLFGLAYISIFFLPDETLYRVVPMVIVSVLYIRFEVKCLNDENVELMSIKYVEKNKLNRDENLLDVIKERIKLSEKVKIYESKNNTEIKLVFMYMLLTALFAIVSIIEVFKNIVNTDSFIVAAGNLVAGVAVMYFVYKGIRISGKFLKENDDEVILPEEIDRRPILKENVVFEKDGEIVNTKVLREMVSLIKNGYICNVNDLLLKINES